MTEQGTMTEHGDHDRARRDDRTGGIMTEQGNMTEQGGYDRARDDERAGGL